MHLFLPVRWNTASTLFSPYDGASKSKYHSRLRLPNMEFIPGQVLVDAFLLSPSSPPLYSPPSPLLSMPLGVQEVRRAECLLLYPALPASCKAKGIETNMLELVVASECASARYAPALVSLGLVPSIPPSPHTHTCHHLAHDLFQNLRMGCNSLNQMYEHWEMVLKTQSK